MDPTYLSYAAGNSVRSIVLQCLQFRYFKSISNTHTHTHTHTHTLYWRRARKMDFLVVSSTEWAAVPAGLF